MADDLPPRSTGPDPAGAQHASTRSTSEDWPAQVADTIVRVVDQVRAKTTQPVITVVRGLVYGLAAALLGVVVAVLAFIGLFRATDRLRNLVVEDAVWLTYLALGLLFTVLGAIVFSMRKPRS